MSEGAQKNDSGPRPQISGGRGLVGRRPSTPLTPGRLPSIRSRDLTLGGVRKKTFAPNIISRKIKEEPKEEVSVKVDRSERNRDRRGDGPGRGRGRPQVIQSHSIFEQGPAEQLKKKTAWDGPSDAGDLGPSHIINIKREKRETEEETKQILQMLKNDKFLNDPGLQNDAQNHPVQLPLAHSGWLFREDNEEEDTLPMVPKEEQMEVDPSSVKVKEEPMENEDDDVKPGVPQCKAPVVKKPPEKKDVPLPELLESLGISGEDALFFVQLPDTLPGQPLTQESRPVRSEVQTEDGHVLLVKDKSQETPAAEEICSLRNVSEGQIGKLVVRKSGKVQLALGKVTLDVTLGTSTSFLQELVSVGVGEARRGEMMVLGHVQHKLVCSPDFESLLEQRQQ
ncbi:PREDICTED: DNA-directed RNA polymerase III subunit RPC4 [Nanorana parkeri]|uniref:DNA-directed RNA polymerase III subunit RPC4 n=1 Tax=Nanorana parkeri TaxID=125878 RepID=UPI000854E493|nr:PREDICTED: DNA-directed RNA polymerase III subunit RPC4 [Nanorana parkeri]